MFALKGTKLLGAIIYALSERITLQYANVAVGTNTRKAKKMRFALTRKGITKVVGKSSQTAKND